ncbi:hypothetical protein [Reyranella sp.]|uniref:hypothetical protein n=1 Tax=Reyranella sp. TaxID=1929291 RepID=UPI003BAA1132
MKAIVLALAAFATMLSLSAVARAYDFGLVRSTWEEGATERQGPSRARGVLVYFDGAVRPTAKGEPIIPLFVELAGAANWDILRISRASVFDCEPWDDDILAVVAERVALLREEGYQRIVVGGGWRGGRLALLAAALPGVDAAIGVAPQRPVSVRTPDVLPERLARAEAKRVAVFLLDRDPLDDREDVRTGPLRRALMQRGASFVIVDRSPDGTGAASMTSGRLARRYRDCLLRLAETEGLAAGPISCPLASGYAVGAEIGYRTPASIEPPPDGAEPSLVRYFGRWEGDDEWGAYFILEALSVDGDGLRFGIGWAESARYGPPEPPFVLRFRLEEDGSLSYVTDEGVRVLTARLESATELDVTFDVPRPDGTMGKRPFRLHKRAAAAASGESFKALRPAP